MASVPFQFSFQFSGKIWQLAQDSAGQYLMLQIRDQEQFTTWFERIDLIKGTRQVVVPPAALNFWSGLVAYQAPFLFVECYEDFKDPRMKDLLIYHDDHQAIWKELKSFQFMGFEQGILKGHYMDKPQEQVQMTLNTHPIAEQTSQPHLPYFYPPQSEGFLTVSEFLGTLNPRYGCEYLEIDNVIVISYYETLGTKFVRKLLVLRGDDEIYHEIQDQEVKGFASGAFMVKSGLLIFIQDEKELHAIKI